MTQAARSKGEDNRSFPALSELERKCVSWFHALDAWTEYWDIYHPETKGRFYFGNGDSEPGLLRQLLPRDERPKPFREWVASAFSCNRAAFLESIREDAVAAAAMEVDALVLRLFDEHWGDARNASVQRDYLMGMLRFATDTLPPATARLALIADGDPRRATAGRHTLEGDLMWFAWALQLEAASFHATERDQACHRLLLAGVAIGCPANFTWRGNRRTRPEYERNEATLSLLLQRGLRWSNDWDAAVSEVRALYRIREWGAADEPAPSSDS